MRDTWIQKSLPKPQKTNKSSTSYLLWKFRVGDGAEKTNINMQRSDYVS
jgi:hypothetical protein